MTSNDPISSQAADRFGRMVAARLETGADALDYEVRERLRAARVRALQVRKPVAEHTPILVGRGGAATLGEGLSLWNRIASVLPLLVLAAGLVTIHVVQNDKRAAEIAEVDAALLTDDLPPAAYADPGFVQYLKSGGE
ncbi:DUF3619 family protein [Ramlibacter sp. G-1-2-2]|uniref:DUF3619 family protein n=1 Tax=Ramlibacter agri TaxID=2728837 RepID=A0A848H854_9BURK|nr:DUF3619 family protein [Ramlibacter agri]NML45550.1 DUF3619 family protein [Ramlibacter agri]